MKKYKLLCLSLVSFFITHTSLASFIDQVRLFQSQADYKALGVVRFEKAWDEVAHESLRRAGKGAEGFIYISSHTAKECYKKFRREAETEFGAASLLYARHEVAKYAELRKWIEVPKLYGFGVGWLHKEYFPSGMRLKQALATSEKARRGYAELVSFLEKTTEQCVAVAGETHSAHRTVVSVGEERKESVTAVGAGAQAVSVAGERLPKGSLVDLEALEITDDFTEGLFTEEPDEAAESHERSGCVSASSSPTSSAAAAGGGARASVGARDSSPPSSVMSARSGRDSILEHASMPGLGLERFASIESSAQASVHAMRLRSEFDFLAGVLQRLESMTNNFLWVPELERFVWIDIF